MKNYCRYCASLNIAYGEGKRFFCNEKMKYVRIDTPTKCKDYAYCGLNEYGEEHKVRKAGVRKRKLDDGEQITMQ